METTNAGASLIGNNRKAIFAAAVKAAGKGAKVIDDGCHLTIWADGTTSVGVRRRRAVSFVRVNVTTLAATVEE